ncbi:hypothetical protein [Tessaracoccus lacteus]|uniref:Chemotaxis protein n=1 Tax=Tessaracoccus lacteus TaxID=3041766 RepID=A0ABY8PX25_9ACTN|nr:hypothetical protein [Tessaracoccus sp. T21]WGT47038.1 hypothetical protein QH948_13105 [Tessaracoccus sp. T21]
MPQLSKQEWVLASGSALLSALSIIFWLVGSDRLAGLFALALLGMMAILQVLFASRTWRQVVKGDSRLGKALARQAKTAGSLERGVSSHASAQERGLDALQFSQSVVTQVLGTVKGSTDEALRVAKANEASIGELQTVVAQLTQEIEAARESAAQFSERVANGLVGRQ